MNSKFLVLSSLFFLGAGCASNMKVAKSDMPEDDTYVAAPPTMEQTKQMNTRMPASVDEGKKSCSDDLTKKDCK